MKFLRLFAAVLLALQLSGAAFADSSPPDTRAAYLRVVDRPKAALRPELTEMAPVDGLKKYHLWFYSDATERVPGYLLLPDSAKFKGPRPAVIVLHGTGGTKDSGQIAELVLKAARAGFIGVAIDGRFHGERTKAGSGSAEYNDAIARAFKTGQGHPFYFDTSWDVMRLIDYLVTRKDVDAARIGLTGISKGGIETYLTTAADTRIAVAVSYIGVQGFKWELDNGQWHARIHTIQDGFDAAAKAAGKSNESVDFVREFYARVAPGIDGQFDGPAMLLAIAPRPLLVVNGDSDANTPIAGVRLSIAEAKPLYDAVNASDKLKLIIQEDTPHRVDPESIEAGIAWFVHWLKP
ncbi:MAG TPA: acetylxylan esterase [Steroidobacteraceae bacterium]|jgi:dienelactone hydrolase|nr:acetylxylan esterase [Steroidobacteraceae bacterium]